MAVVPDPYRTLELPHSASQGQIKRTYRELARKYHPDRLASQALPQHEKDRASSKFADIAAAYALLSDPKRKAEYDHIYKYGGFDDDYEDEEDASREGKLHSTSSSNTQEVLNPQHRKRKKNGVGYACTDPFAFLWSQGKVHSTTTVAGIQIPSRLQMAHPSTGLRFAFSSGQFSACASSGTKKYISKTVQFAHGKKYTRTETTVVHPDGRREIVIEGDDYVERRYTTTPTSTAAAKEGEENVAQTDENNPLPWYMHAWAGIRDKLAMCYNPCAVVAQ